MRARHRRAKVAPSTPDASRYEVVGAPASPRFFFRAVFSVAQPSTSFSTCASRVAERAGDDGELLREARDRTIAPPTMRGAALAGAATGPSGPRGARRPACASATRYVRLAPRLERALRPGRDARRPPPSPTQFDTAHLAEGASGMASFANTQSAQPR